MTGRRGGRQARLGIVLLVAILAVVAACSSSDEDPGGVTVVAVLDGDTIDVELEDGSSDRVRLIGINAPESGECFATEATSALRDLVDGERLVLPTDRSDRDQFDRLLRYVEVDGMDVGETLIADGFALARRYPPDTTRAERYETAQSDARDSGEGLWAPDACGSTIDDGDSLSISAARFDAEGPDAENLNDEWVEIRNSGDDDIGLTGWTVKDESSSNRYTFPDGFGLQEGKSVKLRTGCGDDSDDELFWCRSGAAVWNNDGDTAFLLDPSGNVVATHDG